MSPGDQDRVFMRRALVLAEQAGKENEVPVGAVITLGDKIIAEAHNAPISGCDPTAHAEIAALRMAARAQQNYRLPNTTLYVTIEPCVMCLGAIMHARVTRVVYGAAEPKAGALASNTHWLTAHPFNHQLLHEGGVFADEASALMSDFFAQRRRLKAQLKKRAPEHVKPPSPLD